MSMLGSFWLAPPEKWEALLIGQVLGEDGDRGPVWSGTPVWNAFVALARRRFAEQLQLNSVARFVRRAELGVERGRSLPGTVNGQVNNGYEVTLSVEAVSDLARAYSSHVSFFVAPHAPSLEFRSTRRGTVDDAAIQACPTSRNR